jgi:hypothetical protein
MLFKFYLISILSTIKTDLSNFKHDLSTILMAFKTFQAHKI